LTNKNRSINNQVGQQLFTITEKSYLVHSKTVYVEEMINKDELRDFLEQKYRLYANESFIESDPIQVPKLFTLQEDIEISAFLTATISWGNRTAIIKSAKWLMELLEQSPYDFVINASDKEIDRISHFYYRTFQPVDCVYFIKSLKNIYKNHNGLYQAFYNPYSTNKSIEEALIAFRKLFFSLPHETRTEKHLANIEKQASAKRVNMFLRWLVRTNAEKVDFGIWDKISPADLLIPLDVHVGNVARKLGMIDRKQNDKKSVIELTNFLKTLSPTDPVKYDFALFGLGIFERF